MNGRAGASRSRVVISSVTGKPIPWGDDAPEARPARGPGHDRPIIPDRFEEDAPEPGADESNDVRLARDVPPHWGTGA